uniref:Sulfatase N-terminal domain-containing protein n=1 Tax=Strongyloides stercoralis TaxID=6248 RepID=A0A0K0EKU7_STRER
MTEHKMTVTSSNEEKKKYKHKLIIFSLLLVFVIIVIQIRVSLIKKEDIYKYKNCEPLNDSESKINNPDSSCTFNECNPWPANYSHWMQPNQKIKTCKVNDRNIYYTINDGIISMKKNVGEKVSCSYTCYYPANSGNATAGSTVKINQPIVVDCDVLWVKCFNQSNNKLLYENIELELRKLNEKPKETRDFLKESYILPENLKKYDLHLIVIDSLSTYHAMRALSKTREYLMNEGGVEMRYLNTQADNSVPNAYGFLLNKFQINVVDLFNQKPKKINDWRNKNSCFTPLDNSTYIFDYYRKMGYLFMYADDCTYETFNYPNCVGFVKPLIDHTTGPHQFLGQNFKNSGEIRANYEKDHCLLMGQRILRYHENYLKKYENQPKASLVWETDLLHNELNSIFEQDEEFVKFLQRNKKYYDDSFLIFMGDHGFRLSKFMNTDIGWYEHKNPYFIIKPPKDLINNKELMDNLRKNSIKHVSHLDVYATLLDILTEGAKNNFTNLTPYDLSNVVNDKIKGFSLLRPLPEENRSCYDMNIPPEFCLCQPNYKVLSKEDFKNEYEGLKKAFITELNNKLKVDGLEEKCASMTINENEKDSFNVKYIERNNIKAYEISAITKPGNAHYRAQFDHNFNLSAGDIIRADKYGDQAEVCEKLSPNRKYCYCKILLK